MSARPQSAMQGPLALRWDRASTRERRGIVAAAIVVAAAVLWSLVYVPMRDDIARTRDALARERAALAVARAQVDESLALERGTARNPATEPRAAVERVLSERGLRAPATPIDVKDGRVHVVVDAAPFSTLMSALGTLARDDDLRVVEGTLIARVEPGSVRADLTLAR
jgi:general secretion pathway protein M